jgi:hypothetical protein
MGSVGSWNQFAIMPKLQNWKNQTLDNYWQKGAGGLKKIKKKGCQGDKRDTRASGEVAKAKEKGDEELNIRARITFIEFFYRKCVPVYLHYFLLGDPMSFASWAFRASS